MASPTVPALDRRLGLADAVLIGLAAMIGAGVFVSLGAAQDLAGPAVLFAILIAAAVAFCNATSTAQLSAQYPTSGGTYFVGRQQLGQWWGFMAGWFVIGKTALWAAMALVVAAHLVPESAQRMVAAVISVPDRAEATVGVAVVLLVLLVPDALTAITASAFGVLLYYAVANVAAPTQSPEHRMYPKALQVIGLAGCVLLVTALPGRTIVAGLALLAIGLAYRGITRAMGSFVGPSS